MTQASDETNIMPFPATWMTLEMVMLSEGRRARMRRILGYGLQIECKLIPRSAGK